MTTELPASETLFSDKSNQNTLSQSRDLQIMFEYETIVHYTPPGMFILPDLKSIHTWHGIILVRSGFYKDTVQKFSIVIPKDYPIVPPQVFFVSPVFHPLIDQNTGELDLRPKFPVWKAKKDFLFMVLRYIKAVFVQKDLWTEDFVVNKSAFEASSDEKKFREMMRRFLDGKSDRGNAGVIHKFELDGKAEEGGEKVLQVFRKNNSEEHVKDFIEWFNDNYVSSK